MHQAGAVTAGPAYRRHNLEAALGWRADASATPAGLDSAASARRRQISAPTSSLESLTQAIACGPRPRRPTRKRRPLGAQGAGDIRAQAQSPGSPVMRQTLIRPSRRLARERAMRPENDLSLFAPRSQGADLAQHQPVGSGRLIAGIATAVK